MKTDNKDLVSKHVFEEAGLGKAPFRFMGISQNLFKAGDAVKPGGTCDYCGTGILHEYKIVSADNKSFVVGSNCILKTGDKGIIKAYKSSPEYRKCQSDARKRRIEKHKVKVKELLKDKSIIKNLTNLDHPYGVKDRSTGNMLNALDYVNYVLEWGGNKITSLSKYIEYASGIKN